MVVARCTRNVSGVAAARTSNAAMRMKVVIPRIANIDISFPSFVERGKEKSTGPRKKSGLHPAHFVLQVVVAVRNAVGDLGDSPLQSLAAHRRIQQRQHRAGDGSSDEGDEQGAGIDASFF